MGLYDAYALDPAVLNEGIWVEMREGAQFKIRSDSSERVKKWAMQRAKGQRQLIIANEGILPSHITDKNEIDLCAEVVLSDWRFVTDRTGAELPFNVNTARQVMTDLPSLRKDILLASATEAAYRAGVDALGKTSATVSEPSSTSAPAPTS